MHEALVTSRFSPRSNVFTNPREACSKGVSYVKVTYDKVVRSVKKDEFKGVGMLLRKQLDGYTQTIIVMQISSSVKLPHCSHQVCSG